MGKTKKKKNTKTQLEFVETPIKWHCKPIKCLNERQKEFVNSIKQNDITFCSSGPGAGKTMMAMWTALRLLEKGQYKKIVLVRSIRTVKAENLAALPGTVYEKMEPFLQPFFHAADKLIGKEARKALIGKNIIELAPIAFIRGITEENAIVIFDEAENVDLHTFESVVTRIGNNSKYIILLDENQTDFKNKSDMAPLEKIMDILSDIPGIGVVRFLPEDSAIRHPLIPKILDKLKILHQKEHTVVEVQLN